jgi:hypothetical protein
VNPDIRFAFNCQIKLHHVTRSILFLERRAITCEVRQDFRFSLYRHYYIRLVTVTVTVVVVAGVKVIMMVKKEANQKIQNTFSSLRIII